MNLMYLPDKFTPSDRALLVLGGQILTVLRRPRTVSGALDELRALRATLGMESPVDFWWYALALDALFALGVVRTADGMIERIERA